MRVAKSTRHSSDDFGEISALRQRATAKAKRLGHVLTRWSYYTDGKETAICERCSRLGIINLDEATDRMYGPAVTRRCD